MNYMRIAVLLAIVAALHGTPAENSSQNARIRVSFIGCSPSSDEPPLLRVYDLTALKEVLATAFEASNEPGVRAAMIELPPGYYEFSTGRLPCTASRFAAVLAGVDRSIALKGQDVIHLTERASVAGSIASNDLIVTANCWDNLRKETKYLAEIENGAYYFDQIQAPVTCDINVAIRDLPDVIIFSAPKIAISNMHRKSLNIIDLDWKTLLH